MRFSGVRSAIRWVGVLQAALASLSPVLPAQARETDQFTRRPRMEAELRDSAPGFDAWVNQRLDEQARTASAGSDEASLMQHMAEGFLDPLLPELSSRVEAWATGLSAGDGIHLDHSAGRGIYSHTSIFDVKWSWFTGVSNTLRLGDTLVGVDKTGHFFSQGWQYFVAAGALESEGWKPAEVEESIRALGHSMELGKLGFSTMAMYSPADLAANWAGWRFWQRMLRGPSPYFRVEGGRPVRNAEFRFGDFVTDDWDEALNPPYAVRPELALRIQETISATCRRDERRGIVRPGLPVVKVPVDSPSAYRVSETEMPDGATRIRFECGS